MKLFGRLKLVHYNMQHNASPISCPHPRHYLSHLLTILFVIFLTQYSAAQDSSIGDALDNIDLPWTTGGNATWYAQTGGSYYDGDSLKSGAIGFGQESWVQTSVSGPGTIAFYWKVSASYVNASFLRFYINGIEQTRLTGVTGWLRQSYALPSGTNVLRWTYTPAISGSNIGWLDKVEFASGGVLITTAPSPSNSSARDIALDSDSFYVFGSQTDSGWQIEKRDKVLGDLVPNFGINGVVSLIAPGYSGAGNIAADDSYIYLSGADNLPGNSEWRVEKRSKLSGELVNSFDGDGIVQSNPSTAGDSAAALAIDQDFIYIGGSSNGSSDWRIEKRDIVTGALVNSFGVNGVVTSNPTPIQDALLAMAIDSDYIYAVGMSNLLQEVRIEKREKVTGTLVSGFGTNGVITIGIGPYGGAAESIALDDAYIYIAEFLSPSGGHALRIEKRSKSTGALDFAFGGLGYVETSFDESAADIGIGKLVADSSNLFWARYDTGIYNDNYPDTGPCDRHWRVEKRNKITGALQSQFGVDGVISYNPSNGSDVARGIALDSNFVYVVGHDQLPGYLQWRIERRDIVTGQIANVTPISLTLLSPTFSNVISDGLTASWASVLGASYIAVLARDSGFSDVIASGTLSTNSTSYAGLYAATPYYFQVKLSTELDASVNGSLKVYS